MVQGHEGALCSGSGHDLAAQAAPQRVRERTLELLTKLLMHTGLFSSPTLATSSSSGAHPAVLRGGVEEVRAWLSSLRSEADLRFF